MKYQVIFIGLMFGTLVLGGCTAGSADINETDKINEVEKVEQTENLDQADEASEATNETASTEEAIGVEQVGPIEEPTQVDDAEQSDEVIDEANQAEELAEIANTEPSNEVDESGEADQLEETSEVEMSNQNKETEIELANVIAVEARGEPGSYTFLVGIASPDEGCQQYADWWEVLNEDGELIYRRVLLHSHVNEQPFVRSGGPVEIAADQTVWVRAHMNTSGYGVVAFTGSVQSGFQEAELSPEFALEAANLAPLPDGCDF